MFTSNFPINIHRNQVNIRNIFRKYYNTKSYLEPCQISFNGDTSFAETSVIDVSQSPKYFSVTDFNSFFGKQISGLVST